MTNFDFLFLIDNTSPGTNIFDCKNTQVFSENICMHFVNENNAEIKL